MKLLLHLKPATRLAAAATAGALVLGAAAPVMATQSPVTSPGVVAPSPTAPVGSIMPNFTQQKLTANSDQYSVTIDSVPTTAQVGQGITVSGHTTGFAPGNWVNVWVRLPDGTQMDDGGMIAADGSFTLPATLVYPGVNTIQVSAGSYPDEQWSAPVNINVAFVGRSIPAQGVVYHDLAGRPVVIAAAGPMAGFPFASFYFCPDTGGDCVKQVATNAAYNTFVGVYPVPPDGFLNNAAPNSTAFGKFIYYEKR